MPAMPLLYDILMDLLGQQRDAWKDKRHLKTFIWMMVGLIQEMEVALSAWVPYVHSRATQSASTVRRFSRWLRNPRIEPMAIWKVYVRAILAHAGEGRLYLALDTTSLWGEFCWIRVSLVYRGRALPLAWKVLRHKSTRVAFAVYEEVLRTAAEMVGPGREVVLLADRGFCDMALFRLLEELGWHWRIRIKNTFLVYKRGKGWRQVRRFTPAPGKVIFWHQVYVGHAQFGPVHLAVGRPVHKKEFWYVLSDEPTDEQTFATYALRTDLEELIRDDKSNGFHVEESMLQDEAMLNRLMLALAATTWVLVNQGVALVKEGKRRLVDPHWFRGYSYFRIGRHYILYALSHGLQLVRHWHLPLGPDPEPAMASRRQWQQSRRKQFTKCSYAF